MLQCGLFSFARFRHETRYSFRCRCSTGRRRRCGCGTKLPREAGAHEGRYRLVEENRWRKVITSANLKLD
jgi:hypothetical protein